jgi:ribonuclease HII
VPPRLYKFDQAWREKGFPVLAGVDEAGVGSWAGPVVAAAVVLPADARWDGLNDSKRVAPETRESLFDLIRGQASAWAVSVVEPGVVDEINVLRAAHLAARRALEQLAAPPDLVLFDGHRPIGQCLLRQEAVVKGDGKSASIAAASILAKVTRDRLMREAHRSYPHYGFHENKGYGTPGHRLALLRHGVSPLHRRTYAPVLDILSPSLFPLESLS